MDLLFVISVLMSIVVVAITNRLFLAAAISVVLSLLVFAAIGYVFGHLGFTAQDAMRAVVLSSLCFAVVWTIKNFFIHLARFLKQRNRSE